MVEEGRGHLRASYADREQAIEMLKAAFTQERLGKDEFDVRVGQAFAARTHAQLAAATAGIPAPLIPDQSPGTSRVREQRTWREISQAELAEALGVSRQTVISIENGHYLPSLPLAFRIARFFDLTVEEMFAPAPRHRQPRTPADTNGRSFSGHAARSAGSQRRDLASGRRGQVSQVNRFGRCWMILAVSRERMAASSRSEPNHDGHQR